MDMTIVGTWMGIFLIPRCKKVLYHPQTRVHSMLNTRGSIVNEKPEQQRTQAQTLWDP